MPRDKEEYRDQTVAAMQLARRQVFTAEEIGEMWDLNPTAVNDRIRGEHRIRHPEFVTLKRASNAVRRLDKSVSEAIADHQITDTLRNELREETYSRWAEPFMTSELGELWGVTSSNVSKKVRPLGAVTNPIDIYAIEVFVMREAYRAFQEGDVDTQTAINRFKLQ
ncbi:MAG: hypothetical protein ABEI52_00580 [Halobacteriaceae archaeon]